MKSKNFYFIKKLFGWFRPRKLNNILHSELSWMTPFVSKVTFWAEPDSNRNRTDCSLFLWPISCPHIECHRNLFCPTFGKLFGQLLTPCASLLETYISWISFTLAHLIHGVNTALFSLSYCIILPFPFEWAHFLIKVFNHCGSLPIGYLISLSPAPRAQLQLSVSYLWVIPMSYPSVIR